MYFNIKDRDGGHLNMAMYRLFLCGDNFIRLHEFLGLYFESLVLVLLKTGVIWNSLSNPYKAKQTLVRLNFEMLYFFKVPIAAI